MLGLEGKRREGIVPPPFVEAVPFLVAAKPWKCCKNIDRSNSLRQSAKKNVQLVIMVFLKLNTRNKTEILLRSFNMKCPPLTRVSSIEKDENSSQYSPPNKIGTCIEILKAGAC